MRDIAELWRAGTSFELEFSDLKSQFDVFRAVKRVTADFGWRTFMIMRMPRDLEDATLSGLSIICNWPAELLNRYDQIGIFKDSPIVTRLKNSVIPFRFDLSNVPPGDRVGPLGEVVELLYHHNMPRGIYFPVHDAFGNRAAIVYSGDRPAAGIDEMLQLSMISALLYERISQLKYADEKPAEELSDREIECLILTSTGKTSAEIAETLHVSEHSVNHYLNRAAKKLGTSNRTQAVAKALRIGLIR
jgi:LuxR family transcriptional regulator, quorum-sensing system regulator BjaR1